MTALDIDGASAGYGTTVVLRDVSIVVPPASVVALLGPNGAGKTTLLRAASGMLPLREGTVRLGGHDVTGRPSHELAARGLCHVPEGRGVFPGLTVRQNLVLQGAAGREDEAVERAVTAFPVLGQRLSQLAGTLSGGEQQMLALSHARVSDPAVVLLDEVSMGLAPQVIDDIFAFLADLASGGAALLIVEQYVTRALQLADYVYLMSQGGVAFVGEPAELADSDVFATYLGVATA